MHPALDELGLSPRLGRVPHSLAGQGTHAGIVARDVERALQKLLWYGVLFAARVGLADRPNVQLKGLVLEVLDLLALVLDERGLGIVVPGVRDAVDNRLGIVGVRNRPVQTNV